MNIHEFIFSTQRKKRIQRHILFWVAGYLFYVLTYPPGGYGSANGLAGDGFFRFYEMAFIRNIFGLTGQMIFCYGFAYFLMPSFIWKKKYLQFVCMILLLWAAASLLYFISASYVYNPIMKRLGLNQDPNEIIILVSFKYLFFASVSSRVFIFISLKLFKDWQQKQKDVLSLKKENANAELSLLKAQIRPHFLFNTLNNIYSFTLNKSNQAKYLVKKLSDMLHYMVEECDQQFVALNKEIKLISDYIELEKVRYGKRLDIEIETRGDFSNKLIAPLLMIPFVENSFKHGASRMLVNPLIRLTIEIKEDKLHFSLINSKPISEIYANKKNGIGLSNVRKRLQLLFPDKHYLQIESTKDLYKVNMQLPVQENYAANKLMQEKIITVTA